MSNHEPVGEPERDPLHHRQDDDEDPKAALRRGERPTVGKPVNGERRPLLGPLLAVVGLVVLIAVLYFVISYLRYHT